MPPPTSTARTLSNVVPRFPYRYNAGMRQILRLHPDSLSSAVTHVEAEVTRPRAGSLVFDYFVTGRIGDIRMAAVETAKRTGAISPTSTSTANSPLMSSTAVRYCGTGWMIHVRCRKTWIR